MSAPRFTTDDELRIILGVLDRAVEDPDCVEELAVELQAELEIHRGDHWSSDEFLDLERIRTRRLAESLAERTSASLRLANDGVWGVRLTTTG